MEDGSSSGFDAADVASLVGAGDNPYQSDLAAQTDTQALSTFNSIGSALAAPFQQVLSSANAGLASTASSVTGAFGGLGQYVPFILIGLVGFALLSRR
jgi:hypothetical protein